MTTAEWLNRLAELCAAPAQPATSHLDLLAQDPELDKHWKWIWRLKDWPETAEQVPMDRETGKMGQLSFDL